MSLPQLPPAGGDQNLGPTINAVNWLFTTLATLAVGARLYGRVRLTHNIGWDDFWIVIAIVRLPGSHDIQTRKNLTKLNAVSEYPLRNHIYSKRYRRNWTTSVLFGRSTNIAGHQTEQHSIRAGHVISCYTEVGSRVPLGKTP